MLPPYFTKITAALCGVSMLASAAYTDDLWPAPLDFPSSFEGLGKDVKGADMTMSVKQVHAALGGDLSTPAWRFADRGRLSTQKITRPDVGTLYVTLQNTRDIRDDLRVDSSRWHTGNKIVRMTRTAKIMDATTQPLVDSFLSSVFEKYGQTNRKIYERGLPGLSNIAFEGRLWAFDNGQVSNTCEIYELPNDLREVYKIQMEALEDFLADIDTDEACDAYMEVFHSTTSADTVSEYMIRITDIRLLIADGLNDKRVEAHIQAFLENNVKSGNANSPDL